ncbi:MAG: hypothetical protein ACI9YT_002122 [Halobacteriales archaeon]|jgi:hypothetical protein
MAGSEDRRQPPDVDDHRLDDGYPVTSESLALEYGGRRLAFSPESTGDRFVDVLDRLVAGSYDSPHEVRTGIAVDSAPYPATIREETSVLPGEERVERRPWASSDESGESER